MNKLRTRSAILLVTIIMAMFAVAPAISAEEAGNEEAAESETHAGVVVYFDEETIEYHLIEIPDDEMSGFDLLMETGYELEVEVFEGMGEAVCSIEDTGCPSSDCFCHSFYWQFIVQDGEQWIPQMTGASDHTAEAGEIHAWAWAEDTPDLPEVAFDDMIDLAATDTEKEANDSDSNDATATQWLPFIGVFAVLFGIVAWVGIRRYRSANPS